MRTTIVNLEKQFGNLAYMRGILYYKLSPHELKPFAGAIKYGLPNFVPRTTATIATWLPPFVIGYLIYIWTEDLHWQKGRKNPKDYIDEVDPNPPEEETIEGSASGEKKKCVPRKKKSD